MILEFTVFVMVPDKMLTSDSMIRKGSHARGNDKAR